MRKIKTGDTVNVNIIEVKKLGDFQYGETAIVSLNSDETSELYLEYYKEEVMEYFNISSLNDVFSLDHFSNDSISNMPIDLYEVKVNVLF